MLCAVLSSLSSVQSRLTMTYIIASIANAGGAPEQAYRKLQSAGACPDRPFAGESVLHTSTPSISTRS